MKGRALLNVQEYPDYSKGNIADVNCRTILSGTPKAFPAADFIAGKMNRPE
jgi:hypothetical protein